MSFRAERPTQMRREDRNAAAVPGGSPSTAISVGALTRVAKDVVEGAFTPLWVHGEVSDFKAHRNGHWYFCLRDGAAQMRCVAWSTDRRIPAPPDEGMRVVAFGRLTVYQARCDMQFVVTELDAVGDGLRRKGLDLARARLESDGLLAPGRKRRLARLPRCVAVVTSPDGAALQDIVSIIRRRCPIVQIVVVPTRVQGDGAPLEIAAAIRRVSRWGGADAVIIGRGGGAREDLWAFNEERVARAVAACTAPTISAVGHEVDVTLCDLVADVRAATPSAAAEAAVPVLANEKANVASLRLALGSALVRRAKRAGERLQRSARHLSLVASRSAERRRARLENLAGRLHALSPLATLTRGYAVARGLDGGALTRATQFEPGLKFSLQLRDGTVAATAGNSVPSSDPTSGHPTPHTRHPDQ